MSRVFVFSVAIGLIGLALTMIAALGAFPAVIILAGYGLMSLGTLGAVTSAVLAHLSTR